MNVVAGLRLAAALVFLSALAVPAALTAWTVFRDNEARASQMERRSLAQVRRWAGDLAEGRLQGERIGLELNRAWTDQLAFRYPTTQLRNSAMIALGHSTSDSIQLGRQGHWFTLRTPRLRAAACAAPTGIDEDASKALLDLYLGFEARAETQGVPAYSLIIPNPASVFPDRLPAEIAERCTGPSALGRMIAEVEAAAGHGRILYDLDWFRAQPVGAVYDRWSYHWHRGGGRRYLDYLLTEGGMAGLRPSPLGDRAVDRDWPIDNAHELGVAPRLTTISLPVLESRPPRPVLGEDLPDELKTALRPVFQNGNLARLAMTSEGPGEGVGVLIWDSFTAIFWSAYSTLFETSYRFMINDMNDAPGAFDRILEVTQPDVVVFLTVDIKWQRINNPGLRDTANGHMLAPPEE
jgi:hypothetical protein